MVLSRWFGKLLTLLAIFPTVTICPGYGSDPAAGKNVSLEETFANPPASAGPWVFWGWMNGNITREGITADLEAMSRVGVNGACIFNLSNNIPAGRVRFLSPEWRELFLHALKEADRLGMKISIHTCDGWNLAGGPWITAENSMQILTWSETNISGPTKFSAVLSLPKSKLGYYRDIAVYAIPAPTETDPDFKAFHPKVTTSNPGIDGASLLDGDPATGISLPMKSGKEWILISLDKPMCIRAVTVYSGKGRNGHRGILEASDDGKNFHRVDDFAMAICSASATSTGTYLGLAFEPVTARYFRLLFNKPDSKHDATINEIILHSEARIAEWEGKAGFVRLYRPQSKIFEATTGVPQNKILNLTDRLDAKGLLTWDVPAGRWTIIRLGHTTTAKENHPATEGANGLECDKFSQAALGIHYQNFIAKIIADAGPLAGRSFSGMHCDSWEIDCENWTPRYVEEFRTRRGYDPLPYLPVLLGNVVDSMEISERFLWDARRTMADMYADNFFGALSKRLQNHGMQLSVEGYGRANFDDLQVLSRIGVPMAELWTTDANLAEKKVKGGNVRIRATGGMAATCKQAASAAHTWGKVIAAAETFTASSNYGKWQEYPYLLKALGDLNFCEGINRTIFHTYAHQPWTNRAPGMSYGWNGIQFNRGNTWWEQGRAWVSYLTRCQYLLQQGRFVADVLFFNGENAPCNMLAVKNFPNGFDYDVCTAENIEQLSVKDGRLVLPSGMSYRFLVLPEVKEMTPELLGKLYELVNAGAMILGLQKPEKSPSLTGYPGCDVKVRDLAGKLWGNTASPGEKITGKGKVYWGQSVSQVLAKLELQPDLSWIAPSAVSRIAWIHRRLSDAEIYFIANQSHSYQAIEATFRVQGQQPELWLPDTGQREPAGLWRLEPDGRATVTLNLDPKGSVFVVFRNAPLAADHVAGLTVKSTGSNFRGGGPQAEIRCLDNKNRLLAWENGKYTVTSAAGLKVISEVGSVPPPCEIGGPWRVDFQPGRGVAKPVVFDKLSDWSAHPDQGVRYFSGTAAYSCTFDVPADFIGDDRMIFLDLGKVAVIAEVKLNDHDLGILWKRPYRVNVGGLLKATGNKLEIRITNLWANRLIGDERYPPYLKYDSKGRPSEWPDWVINGGPVPTSGRVAFSVWHHYSKDDPLVESGLLGPITLRAAEVRTVNLISPPRPVIFSGQHVD